jgi:ParB family transcriptional regulator, chromosome partitioning protein
MSQSPSTSEHTARGLRELPLDAVLPNPSQPRRRFDEEALQKLAGSMSECGVLQPVLVRPRPEGMYELVAGERRWRAAKLAGLKTIPALVRAREDAEALEVGLIENMAREDLNPVEEARACVTLAKELGLTYRQIGERVGRGQVVVSNLVRLLDLPAEILELIERGELSKGHAIALLMAKDQQVRKQLARAAIEQGWSTLELERRSRASSVNVLAPGDSGEQALDHGQQQALTALNVARAWGELLGAEVHVRVLPREQLRMEVLFGSAAEGITLADRFAAAIARGSKGSS